MERLTYRKDGKAANCGCYDWCATCTGAECLEVQRMLDRLAAYEDAEEQGLLVRVVRCKDCKHWAESQTSGEYGSCDKDALLRWSDFWCAEAAPKEG
jgi:hypothetical protein